MSYSCVKSIAFALALLLLLAVLPAEGQGVFEIRDRDVLQTLLGPFSHFCMPLLGFYPLRSFFLAPYYMIEDMIASAWPIGALILLVLSADVDTINRALADIRESSVYRALVTIYHLVPENFQPALLTMLFSALTLISGMAGGLVMCIEALPDSCMKAANLITLSALIVPWSIPAALVALPFVRPIYLKLSETAFSFVCSLIPGLGEIYADFVERQTGIPEIYVIY
jgi:hypothetical protein